MTALIYATRELSAPVEEEVTMAATDLMHVAAVAGALDFVSRASELTPRTAAM